MAAKEVIRRKKLTDAVRQTVSQALNIMDEDATSVMTLYRDFYLQISFSEFHPLMVFCLVRTMPKGASDKSDIFNELNMSSVLGCHCRNGNVDCYNYRATHWLETEMTKERFFEILDRCVDEAIRGYQEISK